LTRWRRPAPGPSTAAAGSGDANPAPAVIAPALVDAPPAEDGAETAIATPIELQCRFAQWLFGLPLAPLRIEAAPPADRVARLLEQLDHVIASVSLRAGMLPRAPHVVPQLMKALRDERYSSVDVAERISKDLVLTAEVIRSATSAFQRDDETDIDLARAVAVIGTQGLRRAIASVVLRPIFDARGDSLSARAAGQIWKDADRKARLCTALATQSNLDPFDGYLAGLLHNTGWSAALRAIDGFAEPQLGPHELAHPAVLPELLKRRDALFGALVQPWQLGRGLGEMAGDVGRHGLAAAASPLGAALRTADRLTLLRALAPGARTGAEAVPEWSTLAQPVQECYAGLRGS
jgi:HD-like signal output (HDOD) protein